MAFEEVYMRDAPSVSLAEICCSETVGTHAARALFAGTVTPYRSPALSKSGSSLEIPSVEPSNC